MGIFGAAMPSRKDFVCGNPQTKTTTLRIIQGRQTRSISDFELRTVSEARASARASFEIARRDGRASDTLPDSSKIDPVAGSTRSLPPPVLTSNRQMRFGCQNLRNVASDAIEPIAATTSTSHGPWKLDTRN